MDTEIVQYNITDAALAELAERYKDVSAHDDYEAAKAAKKECQQLRKRLEDQRVEYKAEALAYGRRVDKAAKEIRVRIEAIEDPITESIKEVDEAAARIEAERVAALQAKIEAIREFGRNLDGLSSSVLMDRRKQLSESDTSLDDFTTEAEGAKAEADSLLRIAINKAEAREEEERRLEKQRQEQEQRDKELREREERLKAQEAEQEASRKAEAEKAAAERLEREKADRAAQEAADKARQDELDRQAAEQAKENERLERERREFEERAAAQRRAEEAAEAEANRLRMAPDVEKLEHLAGQLEGFELPEVASPEARQVVKTVRTGLDRLTTIIRDRVGAMR